MSEVNSRPSAGVASHDVGLRHLYALVLRHWKPILAVIALFVVGAAVYVARQQPTYVSEASLRIEDDRDGGNLLAQLSPLGGAGKRGIATEVLVLRTHQLAAEVTDSLALHVQVNAPRLPRSQVLGMVEASDDAQPGIYVLERNGDGAYTVSVEKGGRGVQLPPRVEIGKPFTLGNTHLALHPGLRNDPPRRIVVQVRQFRRAVEDVRRSMGVSRPHPEAQIVNIQYRHTDPVLAAAVPNALTVRFIDDKRRASKAESASTVAFLRSQVAGYEGQLGDAEGRLRVFREGAQVVSPREQASEAVKRLAELQARRDQLQGERQTLGRLLARAESGEAGPGAPSPYRQLASFPVFFGNLAVQDLLRALIEQEDARAQLMLRRMPDNPDVQARTERIAELELQLYQLALNYRNALDNQLAAVDENVARFGVEMQAVPAREIELARLSRQQGLLEEIYTLLQTRLKEAEIQEAADPANVRLIDPGLVPDRPFSPRPVRTIILALLLGAVVGIGGVVAWETLDTKVRTRNDVQTATGGMPILAYIPKIRETNGKRPAAPSRNGKGQVAEILASRLVTRSAPQSPEAEAYRSLRTNLTFSSFETAPRVLVVTSAMPGDGKSTTASNLAITLAQQGSRTLLVDADLRKGLLHQILGASREPGLTNVLLGRATMEAAVQEVSVSEQHSLAFLPTGPYPPNPSEALGSERMRALVEELRGRYDAIIFDAPPLNLVTDAAVLGRFVDATVLVTRAGVTDKGALEHAATQLTALRASVLGVVLNSFTLTGSGYYGYSAD